MKSIRRTISFLSMMLLAVALTGICHAASGTTVPFPQLRQPGTAKASQLKNGTVTLSNNILSAQFTKKNGKAMFGGCKAMGLEAGTELFTIILQDSTEIPASAMTLTGWGVETLKADPKATIASEKLAGKALKGTFSKDGLTVRWRAVRRNGSHYLRTELDIEASRDIKMHAIIPMSYRGKTFAGKEAPKVVGNTRGAIIASPELFAGLETPTGINTVMLDDSTATSTGYTLQGLWSRHTTLQPGHPWEVSTVVGIVAPGQQRRSILAYSERERAVPWRPFPIYNSWYELNIDRNNSPTYDNHMKAADCLRIIDKWHTNLTEPYGANIKSFVWDDGWDSYGTWTFNPNFPNGFQEVDSAAHMSGAGIGAWLGPVGGYGGSGQMRRAYWKDKGGMQLSNPAYYDVFLKACSDMIDNYDFNFFKLDGISAQAISVGPDPGYKGEENAEGIIDIERKVRKMKPDMFFNTTVGTWASPFWYHFSDAIWRQEADHSTIGNQGDDRERWITYRDHMVYDKFIQDSPLCPINTMMTHGVILTKFGDVSKSMDYDGIVREIRCAFACGSGMVELYTDYELLDSINGGKLWGDIAECIKWQQRNADVLPDAHWVGGNPWDGKKANVYGWASWNGKKATLALRNPAASPQKFVTTLRKALDIPAYVKTPVKLSDAFSQQALPGLDTSRPISPDAELTLTLPASSVFVYDGVQM